jgi:hypothetical protein
MDHRQEQVSSETDRYRIEGAHAAERSNPDGTWVVQQARNLTMILTERQRPVR